MDKQIPLQVAIELGKSKLRTAVRQIQSECGLPSYLVSMILSDVRADLAAGELESMAALTINSEKKGEE